MRLTDPFPHDILRLGRFLLFLDEVLPALMRYRRDYSWFQNYRGEAPHVLVATLHEELRTEQLDLQHEVVMPSLREHLRAASSWR